MPRKNILSELKRKEILAIVGIGCSIETAAKYVGCSPNTIWNTIKNDVRFAGEIQSAEEKSEIFFLEKIRKAANKEQYWRAAAWALERRCPNRYSTRGTQTLSEDQILKLVRELTEIVIPEIQNETERRKILKKVKQLIKTLQISEERLLLEEENVDLITEESDEDRDNV